MYVVHEPNRANLGKFSNGKLRTSALSMMKPSADFASALSNVNNVKISDLLAFHVVLLFFSLYSHLIFATEAYTSRKLQNYENIHGENSFFKT